MKLSRTILLVLLAGMSMTGVVLARRGDTPADARDDGAVTLQGTVTKMQRPFAVFEAEGRTYSLHLGPVWYWERQGYSLAAGDTVTITGFVSTEGKIRYLYPQSLVRGDETYTFPSFGGGPAWGGGGWGRGGWGPGRGTAGNCPRGRMHGCSGCPVDCPHQSSCQDCPCGCR